MPQQPKPIPEHLIEKTALKIYQKRLKQGIEGSSDTDWQQATDYLQRHRSRVRLWHLKNLAISPVFWTERRLEDLVALLHRMAIFEILDFAGKAAIIIAAYSYLAGAEDRQKQSNYQAWQVINSSLEQKHGGGRKDALEDLNKNEVSLVGINLKNANIPEVNLAGANLWSANLEGAYLEYANLEGAILEYANLEGAILGSANLAGAGLGSVSEFQSLTTEQLQSSCFWDKNIKVQYEVTVEYFPIDPAIIEEAMKESPYDVAACTKYWDERKAMEAEPEE